MYNPDHQPQHYPITGPRISFSSDFSLECPPPSSSSSHHSLNPNDPDFEFSVNSHQMLPADQLFFKGRILPLKVDSSSQTTSRSLTGQRVTTLRDELRGNDEKPPPTKGIKWKGLLGLRKSGYGKRGESRRGEEQLEPVSETAESESAEFDFRRLSTTQEP